MQQIVHLSIDEDCVQSFLATEVLVHDWLGHPGFRRDLLDAHRFEPFIGEQRATDVEQLLTTFLSGHAHLDLGPRLASPSSGPWCRTCGSRTQFDDR